MELMKASLDKLYRKVYATPDGRVPEEVLRQIAFAVSNDGPQHCIPKMILTSVTFTHLMNSVTLFLTEFYSLYL